VAAPPKGIIERSFIVEHRIKKNQMYYLVLLKRDWSYKPAVIVPVKVVRRKTTDWIVVEQTIGKFKHRFTVREEWLAPHDIEKAKALLHNKKMWEERWTVNGWRFRLDSKTSKSEVPKSLLELSKAKQRKILKQFKKVYPDLLKDDGSFKTSKMLRKHWQEIAWVIIATKYPLKEVW